MKCGLIYNSEYILFIFQNFVTLFNYEGSVHPNILVYYKIDYSNLKLYYTTKLNTYQYQIMVQLQLYIPHISNNITRSIIAYYFRNENIGDIVKANMYNKISSGQPYFVAVMTINLYNTNRAKEFYTKLKLEGAYKFIYDEEATYYWFIKLYDKHSLYEKNNDDIMPVNKQNIPLDMIGHYGYTMNERSPVNFAVKFQDYLYDAISFENMIREINVTIRNYTYELYGA